MVRGNYEMTLKKDKEYGLASDICDMVYEYTGVKLVRVTVRNHLFDKNLGHNYASIIEKYNREIKPIQKKTAIALLNASKKTSKMRRRNAGRPVGSKKMIDKT